MIKRGKENKHIINCTINAIDTISYYISQSTEITNLSQIKIIDSNNHELPIKTISTLGKSTNKGQITLETYLDLTESYTLTIDQFGSKKIVPNEVFDSPYFIENFTYDGQDLGASVFNNGTQFKLWAPTASSVSLNLFKSGNGCEPFMTVKMEKLNHGVWQVFVENVRNGTYYTYSVKTANGCQEAVDPYAQSAGLNGLRGMVVDHSLVNPEGFESESYVPLKNYRNAIIWETHVRDFSYKLKGSRYKGKFLSFTESGLVNENHIPVGLDYLKYLGITHVHLMPVYDFKSVDESKDEYNWGYDPQNYNVPEGSYSTDATNGCKRVLEFKQMVQSLHAAKIGVVMDVVYNHTYETNSNLNKVVPFYFYRYNEDGSLSSGSGCGNDTKSERKMFSKYIVDSVIYWTKTYKIDGFRFDLMGLIDIKTMQKVEYEVHKINPNAIIYGEGWSMQTATDCLLTTQQKIKLIAKSFPSSAGSISVFNDQTRDGIRGSVWEAKKTGYLGNPNDQESIEKVIFGLKGCEFRFSSLSSSWTVKDASVINYDSVHDNNTLYDKLKLSCPKSSESQIVAMNKISAAIVMLCKGTPLLMSGEEILRSKVNRNGTFNDNSYNAGDEVNCIKWEKIIPGSFEYETLLYYKGLIEMRKKIKVLSSPSEKVEVECEKNCLIAKFVDNVNNEVFAVINPTEKEFIYKLPKGKWSLIVDGKNAGANEINEENGEIVVDPQTVKIYIEKSYK